VFTIGLIKPKIYLSVALLTLLLTSSHAVAQEANTQSGEGSDATVTYPASYFSQYRPVSVNDMLDRIPGISLALGEELNRPLGGNDSRGLGASSQVLIDGKRMAGKANETASQLDQIAATQVDYIEIIRGTSSTLDVQNTGQIVNVVLLEAQSRSSFSGEVGVNHFHDGNLAPDGSLAWTGQRGNFNYLISANARSNYEALENYELSIYPDQTINEIVTFESERDQTDYNLNANLIYNFSQRDRLAFNTLYSEADPPRTLLRTRTDYNGLEPSTSFDREAIPAESSRWEIGGDYEHNFRNGDKYRFLFIINEKNDDVTRERFRSETLGGVENKNLFLDTSSTYQEKIVRTSYTRNLTENQGLELGLEAAQTTQDSSLRLGSPPALADSPEFGGLTPVPLPNAVSTVEEIRYEGYAIHNWQINDKLRLESTLVAEFSEIQQTGDISNKRDFDFLKPKLDLQYNISQSFQLRMSAEKFVSQLSFLDFSAATNNRDEDQDTLAGNPELEPEEVWQYNLNLDYRLPNDGGVLNSQLFYYDIGNSIGRIDISPSADQLVTTNGNVGSGRMYGIDLNSSIRLGYFNMPQAVITAGALFRRSFIDDPLLGFDRKVVPYDRGNIRFGFRHDVSDQRFSYGINYRDGIDGSRTFYDFDNVLYLGSRSDLSIFAEKVSLSGLTYRLEVSNILNQDMKRERRRYVGYLRDNVLSELERFSNYNGVRFSLRVRGTF